MPPKRSSSRASPPDSAPPAPPRERLLAFADDVARQQAAVSAPAPDPELHLVTFRLEREAFAVPIDRVREVVRVTDVTRVPEAPPHIRGVTNLRGKVLPVVELRTRLGLSPAVITPSSRILVVEAHNRVLGLLVDGVSRVVKVPSSSVVPPPDEVLSERTDYIPGVARMGETLLILLDLDRALLLSDER
jgi:purine-binding chemotaxis protein CheW